MTKTATHGNHSTHAIIAVGNAGMHALGYAQNGVGENGAIYAQNGVGENGAMLFSDWFGPAHDVIGEDYVGNGNASTTTTTTHTTAAAITHEGFGYMMCFLSTTMHGDRYLHGFCHRTDDATTLSHSLSMDSFHHNARRSGIMRFCWSSGGLMVEVCDRVDGRA
jgi:hypothetical protein